MILLTLLYAQPIHAANYAPLPDHKIINIANHTLKKFKDNGLSIKKTITIVDFSKPSFEKRLWVIDMSTKKVIYHTWVAHGVNSGYIYPQTFSNTPGSRQSSLGVFITKGKFNGKNGESVILEGVENKINHNAQRRGIIIHLASYASKQFLDANGRLGRSLGCFSLDPKAGKDIIDTIYNNTLFLAYYPDSSWLKESEYT